MLRGQDVSRFRAVSVRLSRLFGDACESRPNGHEEAANGGALHVLASRLAVGLIAVLLYSARARVELAPVVIQSGGDRPVTLVCPFRAKIDYSLHTDTHASWTSSHHVGARRPGDRSHSLMCEPVSACRALRINRSRSIPGGSDLASSRRRKASYARRSSGDVVCLMRYRCCMALAPVQRKEVERLVAFSSPINT